VSCRAESANGNDEVVWFAQLRALVSCIAPSGLPLELALVRWYETVKVPVDSEEEVLGMQKIRWEPSGDLKDGKGRERFDLIDICSILKSVFLQPHPCEPDTWFYNHFV
jgi:hypothetical protein